MTPCRRADQKNDTRSSGAHPCQILTILVLKCQFLVLLGRFWNHEFQLRTSLPRRTLKSNSWGQTAFGVVPQTAPAYRVCEALQSLATVSSSQPQENSALEKCAFFSKTRCVQTLCQTHFLRLWFCEVHDFRKVDVRLHGKGNSNSHDAPPVY